jgi:hypothetical protein
MQKPSISDNTFRMELCGMPFAGFCAGHIIIQDT